MPWSNVPPELTPEAERIYKGLRKKGMDKSKASAIMYTTLRRMGKLKESHIQESIFGTLTKSLGKFGALAKRGAQMASGGRVGQYGSRLKRFISSGYNNFKNKTIMKGVTDKVRGMKRNPMIGDRLNKLKSSGLFGRFNK